MHFESKKRLAMASSTELGNCVALALGLPTTALASHVRQLREAGQLTKAGRGITGARMTALDAAKLLIAAASSINIKDGVANLAAYGELKTNKHWLLETMPLPEMVSLPADHTLLDALSALIESSMKGSFIDAVRQIQGGEDVDLATLTGPPIDFTISFIGPVRRARISFLNFWLDHEGEMETDDDDACDYFVSMPIDGGNLPSIDVYRLSRFDLSYQFSFTHRTIQQVANLLKE